MRKIRQIFQIEFILIFIAVACIFTLNRMKDRTIASFERIDNVFSLINQRYSLDCVNSELEPMDEDFISQFQEDCNPFIAFDENLFRDYVKLQYLLVEANFFNSDDLLKNLLPILSDFESGVYQRERKLLFGYDFLVYCAHIFLLISALILVSKKITEHTSKNPQISKIQNEDSEENTELTPKKIIAVSFVILLGITINCLGSIASRKIVFPLYLDSLSTIAITAAFGLFPGILCAVFSNTVLFVIDYIKLPYMLCHVLTAIFAWISFRHYKNYSKAQTFPFFVFMWAAFWSGISNGITGNFISFLYYTSQTTETLTAVQNIDLATQAAYTAVHKLLFAIHFSGILTNISDKLLSGVFSYAFYKTICLIRKKDAALL